MDSESASELRFRNENCDRQLVERNYQNLFTIQRKQWCGKGLNMNPAIITCFSQFGLLINEVELGLNCKRILLSGDVIKLNANEPIFRFIDCRYDFSSIADYPEDTIRKNYFIGQLLGSGSFGVVNLAHDVIYMNTVAIKKIPIFVQNNDVKKSLRHFENLKNELNFMECCSHHPNVVKLLSSDSSNRFMFLIMEHMEEGDLHHYIAHQKYGSISEADTKVIIFQICKGLQSLHRQNIAHLDLKAGNILLKRIDNEIIAKIGDFGYSKYDQNLRKCVGTRIFKAPEVLTSYNYYRYKGIVADIWCLGCLIFYCLAGAAPFDDAYGIPVVNQICEGRLMFRQAKWQNITVIAQNLVTSMLNVKPKNRPTIKQVLESEWFNDSALIKRIRILYRNIDQEIFKEIDDKFSDMELKLSAKYVAAAKTKKRHRKFKKIQ